MRGKGGLYNMGMYGEAVRWGFMWAYECDHVLSICLHGREGKGKGIWDRGRGCIDNRSYSLYGMANSGFPVFLDRH